MTIEQTALDLLEKYPAIEVAAKHLAGVLERDSALRAELAMIYLKGLEPKRPSSRRRSIKHRRTGASAANNRLPTASQRSASVKARAGIAAVFERKLRGGKTLGEIHVRELNAMRQNQLMTSIGFIGNSYVDLVDFVALDRIARHCGRADPDLLVKDCIKGATVEAIYKDAEVVAAEAMRDGTEKFADAVIAAASRDPKIIEHHP